MNEMELLTRLRAEVPLGEPSAQAEGALRTAIQAEGAQAPAASRRLAGSRLTARRLAARGAGPSGPRGWRPGWRIAVAGGLGVTLGAGLLIALAHPAGDSRPTAAGTVAISQMVAAPVETLGAGVAPCPTTLSSVNSLMSPAGDTLTRPV